MTGFNKRVYEMLVRIVVFARAYPHLFERNNLAGQAVAEIGEAVQKLSAHDASLEGGDTQVRMSSNERTKARATLRESLEIISRSARGLKRGEFSMPRGRSDGTLISVGKLWAELAAPLKQSFIESGLPPDFIEKLNAAVETIQGAIHDQTSSNGARLEAVTAIQHTRRQAISALRRLDPIMHNILRDDPPVFAVWQRARRVEHARTLKPAEEDASPVPSRT